MKIAFGMITFQSDYVLEQCLEQICPFATQILIAEGPVKYWQDQGYTTSTDKTNEILDRWEKKYPDVVKVVHGQFEEKDDECAAYMKHLRDDIDYLWQVDSDELISNENAEKIIQFLEKRKPTSVGIKPFSFYGGFDRYIGGFEQKTDNFIRIFKAAPPRSSKCTWLSHRPPNLMTPEEADQGKMYLDPKDRPGHVSSDELFDQTGAFFHHYSYVFASQVKSKIKYYEAKVAPYKVIPNYYEKVWKSWVAGVGIESYRQKIENLWNGVHEWDPRWREETFTRKFEGKHPESIRLSMDDLKYRFREELHKF